jgi:hypothetical protein
MHLITSPDVRSGQFVVVGRVPQAGGAPHLVALCQRPRERKRDLAGGAGDQNLLRNQHPISLSASIPNC